MSKFPWRIDHLNPTHYCNGFNCGVDSLDKFLKVRAATHAKHSIARTYVIAVDEDSDRRVIAYYSISSGYIARDSIPIHCPENYPHLPTVHLGRLAVDSEYQGEKIGQFMLFDAFRRTLNLAEQIGIFGIDVQAGSEDAKNWYLHHDFKITQGDNPFHLFMHIGTLKQLNLFS